MRVPEVRGPWFSLNLYVQPGDHVVIVDDAENPFLSKDIVSKISHRIQFILERQRSALDVESLFQEVVARSPNHWFQHRKPLELMHAYNGNSHAREMVQTKHWLRHYYRPIKVTSLSDVSLHQLCNSPIIVHAYWRAFCVRIHGRYHDRVIRMTAKIHPTSPSHNGAIKAMQYTQVSSNCGNHSRHELRSSQMSFPVDLGPDKLHSKLTGFMMGQDYEGTCVFEAMEERDQWNSVEILAFSPVWFPELHPLLPLPFRERVLILLLCNRRVSTPLNSDCLQLIVRRLFELEGIDPFPVLRLHQLSGENGSGVLSKSEPLSSLVHEISSTFFGMGGVSSWCKDEVPPCKARTNLVGLSERNSGVLNNREDPHLQWSMRGSFPAPLVFQYF